MKKIGITCYPTVGGSGIIATELGMLLAEQGHEIHFITSSLPFRLNSQYPNIFFHEVEITHYPVFQYRPYDLALAAKMAEVIDREKLDILHVHYAMPHAISAILAKEIAEHKVKIITTLHGTDITVLGYDSTFKNMIKYGIEKSDAVTAVSHDLVKVTKSRLGVKCDISVIYNFVNEKEYYKKDMPSLRECYQIKPDEKVVIHISNFRRVKRITDIIYTFKHILEEADAKLLLVGDGPESSSASELVHRLGIEEHVLFLGKQKNISELLSIADVKLLLSEQESFGLVILEAMSCNVACIGTNTGGIPEVINHKETGFIVELGDTKQAAKYAIELFKDKDLYQNITENALKRAKNEFHSKIIVQQYIDLYDEVLKK
ncbi:N-acetyl-alpha-D-glucosaminyl L-malate synthase BshA [Ornithinibacillus sp. 4-3]|uniref:N-acetyl-alpha-D-glucosaminyl L-malate synthase BshA n=1 Tax=Ornithinibacillus sp. 4-3 TaxID=3231488 RepID=A0AB39HW06_9BACI